MWLISAYEFNLLLRNDMDLAKFSSFLSAHVTPLNHLSNPPESHLNDSALYTASVDSIQRRHLLCRSYDANSASGMCVSPVTSAVSLRVRFVSPLFAFVANREPLNNAPQETQHSILVVGLNLTKHNGWL